MKRLISILVFFAVISMSVVSYGASDAAVVDFDIGVTNAEKGIIRVSGTIDKTNSVNETVGVIVIDKAAADGTVYTLSDYESRTVGIAYSNAEYGTGKFSADIGMGGCDSGVYRIYVLIDGKVSEKQFHYISQSDVESVIDDIKAGVILKANLYNAVSGINNGLGANLTAFSQERGTAIFNKRLDQRRNTIDSQSAAAKISSLINIIDDINSELTYVVGFENANVWTDIGRLLADTTYTGIDLSKYNSLSDGNKAFVCGQLLHVAFADGDAVKAAYDLAVSGVPRGGGGGGGNSSASGISMGAVNYGTTPNPPLTRYVFADIESVPWAVDAITALYLKGIAAGDGSGAFAPNDCVTREQFAKMIVMALGIYDEDAVCTFDDGANGWYSPYIASLYNSGIVQGIGGNKFGVGEKITREDMAVMAYNALKYSKYDLTVSKNSFGDFEEISEYAKEAVSLLAGDGILNGTDEGDFAPIDNTTRAEAAVVINSIMGRIS